MVHLSRILALTPPFSTRQEAAIHLLIKGRSRPRSCPLQTFTLSYTPTHVPHPKSPGLAHEQLQVIAGSSLVLSADEEAADAGVELYHSHVQLKPSGKMPSQENTNALPGFIRQQARTHSFTHNHPKIFISLLRLTAHSIDERSFKLINEKVADSLNSSSPH